jgi:hypothetical protein
VKCVVCEETAEYQYQGYTLCDSHYKTAKIYGDVEEWREISPDEWERHPNDTT